MIREVNAGETIKVGSIVDLAPNGGFNVLMTNLRYLEDKGVYVESLNEPALSGETYSALCDTLGVLQYYKDSEENG